MLQKNLADTHVVVHSPGRMTDGGARSTSNLVNCADYLLSTATLKPLPLSAGDTVLVNFGLHDYNMGQAGVPEYTTEYTAGLAKVAKLAVASGATVFVIGTTPAHNTATAVVDDATVVALNKAAAGLAARFAGGKFVDLHTPLVRTCGPVPWADTGPEACPLCAPQCTALSVHYAAAGYEKIASIIWSAVLQAQQHRQ